MSQYAAVLSLFHLDGSNGFRIDGVTIGDNSGYAVASAGDVNGDGYADLIIGAPGADPASISSAGSSYVLFGKATGFAAAIDLTSLDGANGFRLDGTLANDNAGWSVASAGDLNGDGYGDVVVAAPNADPGGKGGAGSSYVVFGKASGFAATFDLASLDGSNGFRVDGVAAADAAGYSVASAGDVNDDGYDDLLVGAPFTNSNTGSAYLVFGKASGFSASLDLASLNGSNGFRLDGVAQADFSGWSVNGAGDVNGDGVADMLVSANGASPNGNNRAGSAYVVFGKTTGFSSTLALSSLNGADGFRIDGVAASDIVSWSLSSAGDVNGDGYADVILGGYGAAPGGRSFAGSSYVVFGKAGGFSPTFELSTLNGANGFRIDGAATYDNSGISVSEAGDFNGDGFGDLIVGAYMAEPGGVNAAGSSYLVFGKASGFNSSLDLGALDGNNGFRIDGTAAYDQSGFSVAAAGDVNGDGLSDVIVGAFGADANGDGNAGASYVLFGKLPSESVTRTGSAIAQAIYGGSGDDVISGLDGADTLIANDGDDRLNGGAGADSALGAAGDDILQGGSGDDRLFGGADSDRLSGGSGDDLLDGGAGDDVLDGGSGVDMVSYAAATRAVTVSLATDARQNTGGAGWDRLQAVENLTGSKYADSLTGDETANWLVGGSGNDTLAGGPGGDTLDGGLGSDTLDYRGTAGAVTLTLDGANWVYATIGGVRDDKVRNAENVLGGSGGDKLTGDALANLLDGSLGADTLTGGNGADIFAFSATLGGGNVDRVVDFSVPLDTIALENAIFTALTKTGELSSKAFYSGAAAHDETDRIIYDSATGALYYDADGNTAGGVAAVQFAILSAGLAMTEADFLVI